VSRENFLKLIFYDRVNERCEIVVIFILRTKSGALYYQQLATVAPGLQQDKFQDFGASLL